MGSGFFCCKEKYFSIKLINYCILKLTHDTDKSKCHNTNYTLVLRHAVQSENFGMVTHAPRVLSQAFLTIFILSECHHRSFLYLKKALTDILFQSKRSIGRFSRKQ